MRRTVPAFAALSSALVLSACSGDTGMHDPSRVSMPSPSPTPEIYRPLVNEAVGASSNGRYDEARRRYNEIIAKDPSCAEADYCRGEIAALDDKYETAIQFYDKALAKNPRLETAYNDRGNCHRSLKHYDKAISDYSIAMLLGPGPVHWVCRAQAYLKKKEYNKAMADATVAISKDPNYDYAYYSRAEAWEGLGDLAQAEIDFDKALAVTKERALYSYYKGRFLLRRHKPELARQTFAAAAAEFPNDGDNYYWMGRADLDMFDYESAKADLGKYMAMSVAAHKPEEVKTARDWLEGVDEQIYDLANKPESRKYQWAIACSAQLFAQNDEGLYSLSGLEKTPKNIAKEKRLLWEWWQVASRDDLLQALDHQLRTGHNARWQHDRHNTRNPLVYLNTMISNPSAAEQRNASMDLVTEYGDKFGERGLLAWDLCRYICLCRWGYRVGFLTEDEAYEHIMPVARRLQSTYSSWKQMGEEYLVGRHYWNSEVYTSGRAESEENLRQLLSNPRSPWVYLPWDLDLK